MQLLIPLNCLIQHHDLFCLTTSSSIQNGRVALLLFAMVCWLKEHHAKNKYVKPFELWWKDLYDTNIKGIIPIQLLICHSVHCDVKFEEETLFLMCPVENIPML